MIVDIISRTRQCPEVERTAVDMYSSQKVDGVDSGPGLQSSGGWEELKALNGIHRVSILWTTLCRGQVAQNVPSRGNICKVPGDVMDVNYL